MIAFSAAIRSTQPPLPPEEEFERVALCHSRSLLRVARRLTLNSAAAEDLVQDCLLLAWRNFHQLRPQSNPRAWLFRILMNAFYSESRRSRRAADLVARFRIPEAFSPPADTSIEVSRALDCLHADHRTVLLLGVVEGFTCGEMSEILSVPLGTIMSRLSRARQAMRARLNAPPELAGKESS